MASPPSSPSSLRAPASITRLITETYRIASDFASNPNHLSGEMLVPIIDALTQVHATDFGLFEPWHWVDSFSHLNRIHQNEPPRGILQNKDGGFYYCHIAENKLFSVGIFIIPPGAELPLHDHPHMAVISKVLYGAMRLNSYSWDNVEVDDAQEFGGPVQILHNKQLLQKGDIQYLLESVGNIHSFKNDLNDIEASLITNGNNALGCAILDVFIPPYDDDLGRKCVYYKEIFDSDGENIILEPCEAPEDFHFENIN